MKKTLLLIFCLAILSPASYANSFSDVTQSHTYHTALSYLKEKEAINGYQDGSFKPYNEINRAELLKLLMESSGISLDEPKEKCFKDVEIGLWYSKYICTAKEKEIVSGYEGNVFKPGQQINKVEALKILAKIYKWDLESTNKQKVTFFDTPDGLWFSPYIKYALEKNYLEEDDTLFKPGNFITRGNIANMLFKHLSRIEIGEEKFSPEVKKTIESKYQIATSFAQYVQLEPKDITIELSWQNSNYDLDIHFEKPLIKINEEQEEEKSKETLNYIFPYSEDDTAYISFDDQKEIVNIFKLIDGTYRFSVKLFSEQESMDESQPVVKIYNQDRVVKIYKFEDFKAQQKEDTLITEWNVFSITNQGDLTDFSPSI